MANIEDELIDFTAEERSLLFTMISFPAEFSIDWFPSVKPSILNKMIFALHKRHWIEQDDVRKGFFAWTKQCPGRENMLTPLSDLERMQHYVNAAEILRRNQPESDSSILKMADDCIHTGVREEDLEIILSAAEIEEKRHKIFSAIKRYESVLDFTSRLSSPHKLNMPDRHLRTFFRAVERRTAFGTFYPNNEKIQKWLSLAEGYAVRLDDKGLMASIDLMLSHHYCVTTDMDNAIRYLQHAQETISLLGNEQELYKRSLKIEMNVHIFNGHSDKATETYERSIGNIESFEDPFSLYAALGIALHYSEIGFPQRGLGICEAIRNQWSAHGSEMIMAASFFTEGYIFLRIKQLANSRSCFEKTLECLKDENKSAYHYLARIGLICIDFQEGKVSEDALFFLQKISVKVWYAWLNFFSIFENAFSLYQENCLKIKEKHPFEILTRIKKSQLYPRMHQLLRRLRITFDRDLSAADKISELLKLEKTTAMEGESFELANMRIELARLYLRIDKQQLAEIFAKKAWVFLHPIATKAFPPDLLYLIPSADQSAERSLINLVIEMGKSLTKQEGIEQLLMGIITSITRMTGAERAALFIRDGDSDELKIAASRNLSREDVLKKEFSQSFSAIQKTAKSRESNIHEFQLTPSDSTKTRKVIIIPLMLNEKNIGVLYQDSRFFHIDFNPGTRDILSALASQIAVSIDRAKAHDEIEELNKKLLQENLYYEKEEFRPFGEIVGTSKAIMKVQQSIRKVAPTQSTVLILGETGVGKELVARAIHRESARRERPFIRINCAALPDDLIDSELFGHERGAFTGAINTKAGRFELADQGTLFLDEISELRLPTQSRLLRVLQEKEFQRVGGTKTLYSDFRLLTATNKDLKKEVEQGRFREDLFYRLNVYPIYVPPLRERLEDIPELALHFLNFFSTIYNKRYSGIVYSEIEKLTAYAWPGNIRELSNVIERAVVAGGSKIRFTELKSKRKSEPVFDGGEIMDLKEYEKKCAIDMILRALEKSGGRIGGSNGAAELLGMKRTALVLRMKRLGIKAENKHQSS